MDYNQVSTFLDKFKKLIFQKEELKKIVVSTISKEISHEIGENDVRIKNGCIHLLCSPIMRNAIWERREKILLELKKNLPESKFSEIK